MDPLPLIASAFGLAFAVCAYKDMDFVMKRKRKPKLELLIGREGMRIVYIISGMFFFILGIVLSYARG
jgi:hypothetical protein